MHMHAICMKIKDKEYYGGSLLYMETQFNVTKNSIFLLPTLTYQEYLLLVMIAKHIQISRI